MSFPQTTTIYLSVSIFHKSLALALCPLYQSEVCYVYLNSKHFPCIFSLNLSLQLNSQHL